MADRVLVLGDDVRAFLGVVRSLGRRELEVHVVPTDLHSPALASKYIAALHTLPAYSADPHAWEAALGALITRFDYRLLIPCSDATLVQLQHHKERLGPERLALPNAEAFAVFTDKKRTRALARQLNVPVAAGQGLDPTDRAADLIRNYGLPLLLKPSESYRVGDPGDKRTVEMIRERSSLEQALDEKARSEWLVEGFFGGTGIGVSVLAQDGRIVLAYQHRRLRQFSETGVSTSRVSEPVDPKLFRDVEQLSEAVMLDGVAMFEFRRNAQSGKHVLLEVNPRFWGSLPLAMEAGADFPAMLYDQSCGLPVCAVPYRFGVVKRDLGGEYERRVIRSEAAPGFFRRLCWSAAAFLTPWTLKRQQTDSWAADDPAPYSAEQDELRARIRNALAKRIKWRFHESSAAPGEVVGRLRSA